MRALLLFVAGALALLHAGATALRFRPSATQRPAEERRPPPRAALGAARAALSVEPARAPQRPWWQSRVETVATPPLTATTNILLAGLDTRHDMPWGNRTDALVVVVLDDRSDHVGLVSIPRDLLVAIPGDEPNRINTVYNIGTREGGPRGGVALLKDVLRRTLGLPIAHSVLVDHQGFEALVDHLDGVTVAVQCPIRDRFIDSRGPGGRLELKLDAGVRHLDGRTALMFARSRHGRSIFDRATRQQAVLLGLRDRLLELGPTRIAAALPFLQRAATTDVGALDLIKLARRAARIKREHIHGLVLDPRHAEATTLADGRWVMIPKPEAIHDALAHLFEAHTPGLRRGPRCPDEDAALRAPARRPPSTVDCRRAAKPH